MSTALAVLTSDLVDDAGLFPPEQLPLAAALARHRADQQAGHPVLTARFICPADRLAELRDHLGAADWIHLSVIVSSTRPALADLKRHFQDDPRLQLQAVEAVMSGPNPATLVTALEELGPSVVRFVEVGVGAGALERLDLLAQQGWAAKVRCGGVRAELFPAAAALAGFLLAVIDRGVPFKATAGLHHAVSHQDPVTGFEHYGFLNLLLAVDSARHSASAREVTEVLLSRDATALAERARGLTIAAARGVRALLRSYGSCSTSEPIAELERLGIGPSPEHAAATTRGSMFHD